MVDLEDRADGLNKVLNARRYFIGGSDARIIMGDDEGALLRLWHELKEVQRRIAVPGGWWGRAHQSGKVDGCLG